MPIVLLYGAPWIISELWRFLQDLVSPLADLLRDFIRQPLCDRLVMIGKLLADLLQLTLWEIPRCLLFDILNLSRYILRLIGITAQFILRLIEEPSRLLLDIVCGIYGCIFDVIWLLWRAAEDLDLVRVVYPDLSLAQYISPLGANLRRNSGE
jgi:hypothetical protein